MKKILVTGGTVFVSKNVAEYFAEKGYEVYGLNRDNHNQQKNNLYREAFGFDCAEQKRTFYIPKDGKMKLQFFYIKDLCRFIDIIIEETPQNHIFNVGNEESVSVLDWVKLCYEVVGTELKVQNVYEEIEQRNYFSFYDYEYELDVSLQKLLLPKTTDLKEGLMQSYLWYKENRDKVNKRDYFGFIEGKL